MFIVDAHQDIAYNAVCFGRDYRESALKKRQEEAGSEVVARNGLATLGLPESIVGRTALVFATLFVAPESRQPQPWSCLSYSDPREAYELASRQLDYYHRLADEDERVDLVRNQAGLDSVLERWGKDTSLLGRKQGLVILMENADPIIEPQQFGEWYERGVRIVGPAWKATRYCGGTGDPGPLTPLGHELLEVMADMNVILDLSHMAEEAFLQAVDIYDGAIIASHSNPRSFCDSDRHLSDEMIRLLASRGGVMGIVMSNHFLNGEWRRSDGKNAVTLTRVVDAIDHVCQLTGSAAHVGIGSDFDGGFGAESIPLEFDTVADLWQLRDALSERGFSQDNVAAILGGNMLRKLRESLPS